MTVFPFADGTGRIAAYCPACHTGTLIVQLLDHPPRYRFRSGDTLDQCSAGCPADRIHEALT